MKLKIISLAAIAAVAGPAFAQSNLTLHGNLDVGLLGISNTSGGVGYIPSPVNRGSDRMVKDGGLGASNWGLRGTEDLGGGLRALFQIQGNLALDTGVVGGPNSLGTTSMWNQTAAIGLAHNDWGTIRFGRQVSPTYWAMAATDARGGRYFGSALTALVGINSASGVFIGDNSNVAFGTVYNDNAILYTSPTWSHVTANLMYAMGETGGKTRANSQQAATAVYDDSHLKLSALFYNGYGNNLPAATALYTRQLGSAAAASAALTARGLTTETNTNRLSSVGALYTWDTFTVSASYMAARNPSKIQVVPVGSTSLDMWSVGAGWRISPFMNLTSGYYHIDDNTNAGNKATQFAIALDYHLSKRTIAYIEGATTTNDGANMNLSPVYATPVAANQDVHALMAGLRHSF